MEQPLLSCICEYEIQQAKTMESEDDEALVRAEELRQVVWREGSRPSLQWVRQHTGEEIPAVKIGRLYFYNPRKVREALGV